MKKNLFTIVFITLFCFETYSQSYVDIRHSNKRQSTNTNPKIRRQDGYYKHNGTYVQPHTKTENNSTNLDNYSTQGNKNPYSQQRGTKAKDYSTESLNYGEGKQIHTGERGGQYYINSNGNKIYVPKQKNITPW